MSYPSPEYSHNASLRSESASSLRAKDRIYSVAMPLIASIFDKIQDETSKNSEIQSFTAPLIPKSDKMKSDISRRLLRERSVSISLVLQRRMGRQIMLSFDESVEPPQLTVYLDGTEPPKNDNQNTPPD